jgi:hypothetical protein
MGEVCAMTSLSSGAARIMGVSIKPGETLFTVMRWSAKAWARLLDSEMMPPLDEA